MTKRNSGGAKPRITLTVNDYEELSVLADAAARTMPEIAAELAEELDRAHVLPKGRHPIDTVCMGCEVDFRDDMTGRVQNSAMTWGVVVKDGLAYVNDMHNGLWIVRIEPKAQPLTP